MGREKKSIRKSSQMHLLRIVRIDNSVVFVRSQNGIAASNFLCERIESENSKKKNGKNWNYGQKSEQQKYRQKGPEYKQLTDENQASRGRLSIWVGNLQKLWNSMENQIKPRDLRSSREIGNRERENDCLLHLVVAKHMRDPNKRKWRERMSARREWQRRRAWWKGIKMNILYVCTLVRILASALFHFNFIYIFLFAWCVGVMR